MNHLYFARLASCLFLLGVTACSKREPQQSSSDQKEITTLIDACSLLTSKDVEAVQGAPLKNTKRSANTGGLVVSQCYYLLPEVADSIVLTVTQRGNGTDGRDPKAAWAEIFHDQKRQPREREEKGEAEREREGERGREAVREEEEKESAAKENIGGLGDEAFWVPRRFGGRLYVLKGNVYISVALGGPKDQASKAQKAKALAEMALKRLPGTGAVE